MHNISFSFSLWCWWNLHVEVGSCGLNISRVEQTLKPWELIKSVLILTLPLYTFLPSPSLDSCLFILPFPCSLPSYPPLPLLPIPSYHPLHFHPTFLSSSSLAPYNLFLLLITLQTTFLISHLLLPLLHTFVFSSFFLSTFYPLLLMLSTFHSSNSLPPCFFCTFTCSLPSYSPLPLLPRYWIPAPSLRKIY